MNVFVLLTTKEDILKNVGNRAVLGHHWLFLSYYGSQWCPKTAWLQTFFKISSFVFCRTKKCIQVNDDRIFIFGWTIPLREDFVPKQFASHSDNATWWKPLSNWISVCKLHPFKKKRKHDRLVFRLESWDSADFIGLTITVVVWCCKGEMDHLWGTKTSNIPSRSGFPRHCHNHEPLCAYVPVQNPAGEACVCRCTFRSVKHAGYKQIMNWCVCVHLCIWLSQASCSLQQWKTT